MLTEEQKLEIGRMLGEGVSDAGIQAVVAAWKRKPFPVYAAFVEYGNPPDTPGKIVDGSLVEQVTDPARLLEEAE